MVTLHLAEVLLSLIFILGRRLDSAGPWAAGSADCAPALSAGTGRRAHQRVRHGRRRPSPRARSVGSNCGVGAHRPAHSDDHFRSCVLARGWPQAPGPVIPLRQEPGAVRRAPPGHTVAPVKWYHGDVNTASTTEEVIPQSPRLARRSWPRHTCSGCSRATPSCGSIPASGEMAPTRVSAPRTKAKHGEASTLGVNLYADAAFRITPSRASAGCPRGLHPHDG